MSSAQLNASLLRLKLLDALRSGDVSKVDSIITELTSTKSTIQNADIVQLRGTILHYAVQVAPLSILQHLIHNSQKFNLDVNSQDPDGNTPLHLAAISSRPEIVKYLLALPDINDTIVNVKKKQPVEECKDLNIAQMMQIERAKFVEKLAGLLRQYFSNRDFENLENLLVANPRASELLDINGSDPETGNTVLHEFIKKDDIQMCDWILKHGGDPFKRDKRGKLPVDLIQGKNEPLKKLLKVASKDQTIMDPVVNTSNAVKAGGAPTYKGYLRKWTNFAGGYKLRYFQLDEYGILSYYTNQDDTNNACRGSLNLGFATLHLDSSEKLKFEIIGKNGMRWHLKANHPIETNRWVWTLQNAITIAKDNLKRNTRRATQSDEVESTSDAASARASEDQPLEGKRHRFHIRGHRKHKRNASSVSLNSNASEINEDFGGESVSRSSSKRVATPNLGKIQENKNLNVDQAAPELGDQESYNYEASANSDDYDYDLDDDDFDSEDGSFVGESESPNHDGQLLDQISTIKRSVNVELTSLLELFSQVVNSKTVESEGEVSAASNKELSVCHVGLNTLSTIQDLFNKYDHLVQVRDTKNSRKYTRQVEVSKLWENSIRQLEDEIHQREAKLAEFDGKQKQLKKFFSSNLHGNSTPNSERPLETNFDGSELQIPGGAGVELKNQIIEDIFHDSDDEFFDAEEEEETQSEKPVEASQIDQPKEESHPQPSRPEESEPREPTTEKSVPPSESQEPPSVSEDSEASATATGATATGTTAAAAATAAGAGAAGAGLASTTSTTSDATTAVPEKESTEKSSTDLNETQQHVEEVIQKEGSFLGYENPPRKALGLDEDNRPKVSVWGILKSMIGKDMTKMTLPVSLNEPTSLVQRLAEDIEYCRLLNQAATFEDSSLRTLYVSTFASSLYASSTGRIAKPFNPLLGETFEYCRPEQDYRLLVEQVSHHPPISACNANSAKWDYYGENAVESSFKGRSFDVKHLGKMFCTLRPDHGVKDKNGNIVEEEHYSWKKVNTSVVGIIMGNPTIDNFGTMEVTNHTTGDKILVDMKQRGWKASSAYQLSGQVVDKDGKPRWAMGGHWNSKIFGKSLSKGSQGSESLVSESGSGKVSLDPFSGSKFLIWEVDPRPKIPFNLTAFATTLNGIDDKLKKWLPPTDTRLRPDQRAMEDGKYDFAALEKHRVEEKQRAAKRAREQKKIAYKPNFFVREKHPITGDPYWRFKGDYWALRKDHKLDKCGDIF